jgi:hypothetical protein
VSRHVEAIAKPLPRSGNELRRRLERQVARARDDDDWLHLIIHLPVLTTAYAFGYFGIICISRYSFGVSLVPMGATPGFTSLSDPLGLVVVPRMIPAGRGFNPKEIDMDKRFRRRKHRR